MSAYEGLGMPDLENHWFAERLAYLGQTLSMDMMWRRKQVIPFLNLSQTPKLKVDISLGAKHRLSMNAVRPFAIFQDPVTFLSLKRSCIRISWHALLWFLSWISSAGRWRRFACIGIGCQVWASWKTEFLLTLQLDLQSGPGRHARLSSLWQWLRGNGWACLLLLRVSLPVLESCQEVDSPHQTHAAWYWLRHRLCFTSVSGWEACGVSRDPNC